MPVISLENFVMGLLNISMQAAVIFCILFLVRAVFSLCRVPKKYTCFLWVILFVRLLMPVQPESPVGLWTKGSILSPFVENPGEYFYGTIMEENIYAPEELQGTGNVDAQKKQQGERGINTPGEWQDIGGVDEQEKLLGNDVQTERKADMTRGIWLIMFIVWGMGCLGFLLYGGISCLFLKKKLRCSIKREDNCYLADGIPTAFVKGVFLPKIYLPSELRGEDLDYVILHERTHIKRRDHLVKMAAYLITCIYWFHPFVWAALIFISKDIELSCDEAVLRELGEGSRRAYADTLLRLSGGKSYFAGIPLAFGEGDTESRIRHIVRYRKPVAVATVIAVVMLTGLTVCLLTGRTTDGDRDVDFAETRRDEGAVREAVAASLESINLAESHPDEDGENNPDSINSRFPEPVELSSGHTVTVTGDVYNIAISIDGEAYRMADLCDAVNALRDIREFGKYIVVTGHISPDNSYYGFYSTESKQWEWELIGSLLTWDENWKILENPIESVIYAENTGSQGVIRDWKTNMIAVFDLKEEYIYGLKREGDDITITIVNYEGESRELYFDFRDSFYTLYHW